MTLHEQLNEQFEKEGFPFRAEPQQNDTRIILQATRQGEITEPEDIWNRDYMEQRKQTVKFEKPTAYQNIIHEYENVQIKDFDKIFTVMREIKEHNSDRLSEVTALIEDRLRLRNADQVGNEIIISTNEPNSDKPFIIEAYTDGSKSHEFIQNNIHHNVKFEDKNRIIREVDLDEINSTLDELIPQIEELSKTNESIMKMISSDFEIRNDNEVDPRPKQKYQYPVYDKKINFKGKKNPPKLRLDAINKWMKDHDIPFECSKQVNIIGPSEGGIRYTTTLVTNTANSAQIGYFVNLETQNINKIGYLLEHINLANQLNNINPDYMEKITKTSDPGPGFTLTHNESLPGINISVNKNGELVLDTRDENEITYQTPNGLTGVIKTVTTMTSATNFEHLQKDIDNLSMEQLYFKDEIYNTTKYLVDSFIHVTDGQTLSKDEILTMDDLITEIDNGQTL